MCYYINVQKCACLSGLIFVLILDYSKKMPSGFGRFTDGVFLLRTELPSPLEEVQNGETFLFSGSVVTRVKSLVPDFITQLGTQVVAVCC